MAETAKVKFVPLQEAMAQLGATDQSQFISTAKRHKCYLKKGGIVRINITVLEERLNADFVAALEKMERRSESMDSDGRKIGLIRARLKRAPGLIKAKSKAIAIARDEVENAPNAYEKHRAQKKLVKLENGLKRLKENQARDEAELERILNGPDTSESEPVV